MLSGNEGLVCGDNYLFGFEPIELEVSENREVEIYCKKMVAVLARVSRKFKTKDTQLILHFVVVDLNKYMGEPSMELNHSQRFPFA